MNKKPLIWLDTAPAHNDHSHRGIGVYTKMLWQHLQDSPKIELISSTGQLLGRKIDLWHFPTFDLFKPSLKIFAKNTIVTIHDVIPLVFAKNYLPGKKGALALLRQRFALRFVKAVITDSFASKSDIQKYLKVPADKIWVVPLAARDDLKPLSSAELGKWRTKLELPKAYILYVGDINYNKNIPQLIKAVKYLPSEISLVLLGKNFYPHEIPEWQIIERQVALSDVADRVRFMPNVPADDPEMLSAIYGLAKAYVQPSLYEGFGLPVLEALSCKTVVVSTKNGSLPEVGGNKVVYAGDSAEELAEKINEVMAWPATKREKWLKEGIKWAHNFSWLKTANKTIKVYLEVLNQSS